MKSWTKILAETLAPLLLGIDEAKAGFFAATKQSLIES
jgi:hypothetical protein